MILCWTPSLNACLRTVQEELSYVITMLEESLSQMKPNMRAIQDYRQKHVEYLARVEQLDRITAERDNCRKVHDGLRKKRCVASAPCSASPAQLCLRPTGYCLLLEAALFLAS